nr:DUF4432 family protein [Phytoactinopolyspora alkaliphila]
MFPNAGNACSLDGHQMSKHGDIQHQPWQYEVQTATPETVEVAFRTRSQDLPFDVTKTIRLRFEDTIVHVSETITNVSDRPLPYLWGHHITFGEAFMAAASRISLPDTEVFARDGVDRPSSPYAPGARGRLDALPARGGGTVDLTRFPAQPFAAMLFADALPEYWYDVWSEDLGAGVTVTWDGQAFPALWIWATNRATPGKPELVACALEPQASAVPTLAEAAATGAAPVLQPGATRDAWLRVRLHHTSLPTKAEAHDHRET